nr:MFS transporter [Candidatus Njordarchaeota archaeon]
MLKYIKEECIGQLLFTSAEMTRIMVFSRISLGALYVATFVMRAAGFATIAVATSGTYLGSGPSADFMRGVIVASYPAAELVTVMGFGAVCDKIGRKPILVLGHFLTALAAFSFIFSQGALALMIGFSALFGVGAAAKVASTLTMISDMSTIKNRAQYMGIFDITTLGGLAGGYVGGAMLINLLHYTIFTSLILAGSGVLVSVFMVLLLVKETMGEQVTSIGVRGLFKRVFSNKEVLRLLPVYTPIICLYGLIIAFAESIAESGNIFSSTQALLTLGVVGLALISGLLILGRVSDRLLRRKPFIIVGLFCFGILASILTLNVSSIEVLWPILPLVGLVSFGAGAFPPAILAYLSDISKHETRGTTFGVYSMILGTGMIVGPLSGSLVIPTYGAIGFVLLVCLYVVLGALFSLRLPEPLKDEKKPSQK